MSDALEVFSILLSVMIVLIWLENDELIVKFEKKWHDFFCARVIKGTIMLTQLGDR
jgi:hypothetical protein